MGCNLRLSGSPDGEHATDLCSNGGYAALCAWLESLPRGEYPAAHALAKAGTFTPTDVLSRQLHAAFASHPPKDPDTAHAADRLLGLLGRGRPGETAEVTD